MITRSLSKVIDDVSRHFPVVLLTGPRQVGKTTLMQELAKDREYVTLDDLEQRKLAIQDPKLFLQSHKTPILIDEVQYAPELFSYIKIEADKNKRNGDFWLTGSQKFHLMRNVSESLAGRVAIIDMLGISQAELQGRYDLPFLPNLKWISEVKENKPSVLDASDVFKVIYRGCFPKLHSDSDLKNEIFYSSYLQTYIERDVRSFLKVGYELKFLTFIKVIAARTGQLLNSADIARDTEIDLKTVQAWISILEASGIIKLLYPYHNNLSKRLIRAPKIYFLDTGLCCYLVGWDSHITLMNSQMAGNILETYVFAEILKSYWNNGLNPNIYFYRDKEQKEIDFIIEKNETLYPIEVKKTATPSNVKLQFDVLTKLGKQVGEGALICFYNELLPISEKVFSVPVSYI